MFDRLTTIFLTLFIVVFTINTANSQEMLQVDQNVTGDISQNTEPLHIGDANDERHWAGGLDEVRVYNRALSEEEVLQNFEIQSNFLPVEAKGRLTTTWGKLKTF